MAITYAAAFAEEALNAYAVGSITHIFDAQFDWTEVGTITVPTNDTVALAAYVASAGYGTPTLVGNTVQTLTPSADQFFSAVLDKRRVASVGGTMAAAEYLAKQNREVVIPTMDQYNLYTLCLLCPSGQESASAAITSANAYTEFMAGVAVLDEAKVPRTRLVAFITPAALNSLKTDGNFVKASDIAQQMLINGQVGSVDGVPLVMVPASVLNATDLHTDFMIVDRSAVAAPRKLADVNIVPSSERFSGTLVNARFVWDIHLLTTLNAGIYRHRHGACSTHAH